MGNQNNKSFFKDWGDDCPVESVSWYEAQDFIRALNKKESVRNYRLPTEAEWEYAARAGGRGMFCFGDEEAELGDYAVYWESAATRTYPVMGDRKPNAWGLYDMHGNVEEWCQDFYGNYPTTHVTDPPGPKYGKGRVLRGGSWWSDARFIRSAARNRDTPGDRGNIIGFRVAMDP